MSTITIRNLDDSVKQVLRERAAARGVSMEQEVRDALSESVAAAPSAQSQTWRLAASPDEILALGQKSEKSPRALVDAGQKTVPAMTLSDKRILLIIGGGIAAYKALDLIRRLRERGAAVRVVMTAGAQEFITTLSAGALSADHVFTELFDRNDEHDVGHIRLSREADLLVVAPATADLMAKAANGHANDLASTVLLATDKPVLMAPAMNPRMWAHPATRRNRATLGRDGVAFVGPAKGEMAESNEAGEGRMAEPLEIVAAIEALLDAGPKPLSGRRIIVTSGPTHEPIDPVRYIANRSSGKQGFAIAAAAQAAGADVTLIAGPVGLDDPADVTVEHVESARDMLAAVEASLPTDVAIFTAAVADWRVAHQGAQKLKKTATGMPPLKLVENPDILATISNLRENRPALVIGFAAETEHLIDNATTKFARKGCDWMVANDVSPATGVMGGDRNTVHLLTRESSGEIRAESFPLMTKEEVAAMLIERIVPVMSDQPA